MPIIRKMFLQKIRLTIANKILLMVIATAFFTSLFVGSFFFSQTSKNALEIRTDELANEVRLLVPPFMSALRELNNDVSVLLRTPPITGLMRSIQNSGIDPADGTTTELWTQRLETVFASIIGAKSNYVQIRYIGVANNGRELVRVNRTGGKIERVPQSEMQEKGHRFYFQEALNLAPETVYHTAVSPNYEHGKIQEPFLPVIRTIIPVHDDKNKLFGMIIINAAYADILKAALQEMELEKDLYIINDSGDFIKYNKNKQNAEFQYRTSEKNSQEYSLVRTIISSPKQEDTIYANIDGEEQVLYYTKQHFNPVNQKQYFATAIAIPKDSLLTPVHDVQKKSIILTAILILITSIISAFFASLLIKPLKSMIREIKNYREDDQQINLPTKSQDEIGDLARAFENLITKLSQSRAMQDQILARLQTILDNTVDGLITIDEMGNIETFNKACQDIFGYEDKDVIGKNVKMLMPDPYHREHDGYLKNYHDTGDKKIIGIGREVQGKRKDGSIFPLDLSVSEVNIKGKKLYSGIVRDITDRKKAEDEIIRSNGELERFAYVASHDLQEPLRMIANFTGLLESEYKEKMDEQAAEYMNFISDAAHRMQDLVGDLLEYSRIGNEGAGLCDVDSDSLTHSVLKTLSDIIDETGAVITIENLPVIQANPVRFSRLMQNLIGNGIKYHTPDRNPEIHIQAEDQNNEWLFSIKDNGIGIKKEYLEQIFIIFKRLHGKKEYKGTGIGLAVCKKIVDGLDGKIWATSAPSEGTTFYFTIPKKEDVKKAA